MRLVTPPGPPRASERNPCRTVPTSLATVQTDADETGSRGSGFKSASAECRKTGQGSVHTSEQKARTGRKRPPGPGPSAGRSSALGMEQGDDESAINLVAGGIARCLVGGDEKRALRRSRPSRRAWASPAFEAAGGSVASLHRRTTAGAHQAGRVRQSPGSSVRFCKLTLSPAGEGGTPSFLPPGWLQGERQLSVRTAGSRSIAHSRKPDTATQLSPPGPGEFATNLPALASSIRLAC